MARQLNDPGWKACTAQTKMTSSETDSSRAPLRSQTTNRALTGAFLRSLNAGLIYAACIWLASLVRYDFSLSEPNFLGIGLCAAVGLAAFLLLGPAFVYRGRFWKGSGDELIAVGGVLALASAAL